MAKKKKKSSRNDARGYNTGTTNSKGTCTQEEIFKKVGKSTKSIQVTNKAYDELTTLLEALKDSIYGDNNDDNDSCLHEKEKTEQDEKYFYLYPIVDISMENKRFVKKITALNDNLEQLGFTDEQIKKVLVALIFPQKRSTTTVSLSLQQQQNAYGNSILSLENALDWLCLHIPSNDLPKLFTDENLRSDDDNKLNLTIIKAEYASSMQMDEYDRDEGGDAKYEKDGGTSNFFNVVSMSNDNKNVEKMEMIVDKEETTSNDAAEKRALLLAQYQYEDDQNTEDNTFNLDDSDAKHDNYDKDNDTNKMNLSDQTKKCNSSDNLVEMIEVQAEVEAEQAKIPEQLRLEALEEEVRLAREDVNDDVNNYMRSKQEIAQMKKNLKKLENSLRGLRAKVAKKLAALEAEKAQQSMEAQDDIYDDDEGCGIGLFDLDVNSAPTPANELQVVKVIEYIDSDIPSTWSGKTPKEMLIEHCRKQKWTKPSFSKLGENTTNGCRLTINSSGNNIIMLSEEGPFRSILGAENYVSTKALYALNPKLPMYLMMPPTFRDLWTSWLKEEELKLHEALKADEKMTKEKIATLILYLSSLFNKGKNNDGEVASGPIIIDNIEDTNRDIVENWDDASFSSLNGSDVRCNKGTIYKSLLHLPTGEQLRDAFQHRQKQLGYERMYLKRQELPIFDYRQQILDTINNNSVTILCAETGAGKTTQCPQFILEEALLSGHGDKANILCTQPRRISAISVAERVAEEMNDTVGRQVGYHIRMESKKSKQTKLLFCTTGVVLRRLQDDPTLEGVTHVIVDEVHERQWEIDFLLITLRQLLNTTRGASLKVILMSATLDSKLFCSFFQDAPFLSIPGRTFPVSEYFLEDILDATDHIIEEDSKYAVRHYSNNAKASLMVTGRGGEQRKEIVSLDNEAALLEVSDEYEGYKMSTRRSMERVNEEEINYDLIEDLLLLLVDEDNDIIVPPVCNVASESNLSNGSILIFLPGIGEIKSLYDRLKGNVKFGDSNRFDVIPMHSTLSPKEQKRAFIKARQGCQKIILATNIAETSITIDDCIVVIDTGLVREVIQDKRSSTSKLVTVWCSKASSKQRAGRAGRVQPGICCRLFSLHTASSMKKQSIPELQRLPLEEVCLTILAANLSTNCRDFLMQAPQPPSDQAVSNALKVLEEVNAIEPMTRPGIGARVEKITSLGEHLAKLPVDIRLGKMLIFGTLFKVLDKILTIAATLSSKSPFSTNINDSQQAVAAHKAFAHPTSDFLTICNVWDAYCSACEVSASNGRRFCDKNYLNRSALIEISNARMQFVQHLGQIGFVDLSYLNSLKTIAASRYNVNGSNENILGAVICAGLYPNCAHILTKHSDNTPTLWHKQEQLFFHKSSVNHNKKYIDSEWIIFHEKFSTHKTQVSTTSLIKPFSILLFGNSIDVLHLDRKVVVDGWIELCIPAQTGVIFKEIRQQMSKVLEKYISNYGLVMNREDKLISGIIKLLMFES